MQRRAVRPLHLHQRDRNEPSTSSGRTATSCIVAGVQRSASRSAVAPHPLHSTPRISSFDERRRSAEPGAAQVTFPAKPLPTTRSLRRPQSPRAANVGTVQLPRTPRACRAWQGPPTSLRRESRRSCSERAPPQQRLPVSTDLLRPLQAGGKLPPPSGPLRERPHATRHRAMCPDAGTPSAHRGEFSFHGSAHTQATQPFCTVLRTVPFSRRRSIEAGSSASCDIEGV